MKALFINKLWARNQKMSGNAPNQFRCSKGFQKKKKEQTKTKQ